MSALAIVQARMGSTRMPGKVLMPLSGMPMLFRIVERLRQAKGVREVVVATSDQDGDKAILAMCKSYGISSFAGSESDVLGRFVGAIDQYGGSPVLRITADCPLVDPTVIDNLLKLFQSDAYDYVAVATGAGALNLPANLQYPDGLDAECMRPEVLTLAANEAVLPSDREHVTPFIWRQPEVFRIKHLVSTQSLPSVRLTVDNQEDFDLIEKIFDNLYRPEKAFLLCDVIALLKQNPSWLSINQTFVGQEGYDRLWGSR